VWIHGDVSAGEPPGASGPAEAPSSNFGMLGVGDPACDLSIGLAPACREPQGFPRMLRSTAIMGRAPRLDFV